MIKKYAYIDQTELNYPIELPLDIIEIYPDIYSDGSFILNNDYNQNYKIDESGILLEKTDNGFVPVSIHGDNISLSCIIFSDDEISGKDITIDYSIKFTNNKVEHIRITDYSILDSKIRLEREKSYHEMIEKDQNIWYNKYILHSKPWEFLKTYLAIIPIFYIKIFIDKLYMKLIESKKIRIN